MIKLKPYDEFINDNSKGVLFPKNQLTDLTSNKVEILEKFKNIINCENSNERDILNFINSSKENNFLVGSLLKRYSFGNHDSAVFTEMKIGTTYQADYLLLGKNSRGWFFLFVELEKPNSKRFVRKCGRLGIDVNKGIEQLDDWKKWLEQNFSSLQEFLKRHKSEEYELPEEFYLYNPNRIYYAVIAGRRINFDKKSKEHIMQKEQEKINFNIYHYDNLIDSIEELFNTGAY